MPYTRLGKHTVNAVRLAEVVQVMVRHGFADLLRRAGFHDGLPARALRKLNLMDAPSGEPATLGKRLRNALVELGPTYVKFGQILSTRPDLVGPQLAAQLSDLQDRVDPLPFATMAKVVEEALGQAPDQLFARFDEEPVASASLSQVYRATLKTGEAVAVKVQRPGIARVIESDLSLMGSIAEWVGDHLEEAAWVDPPGLVQEFGRSIRRELDFHIEAQVIEQFRGNFEDNDHVFVPRVYPELSSEVMMTMDWVDGVRVDDFDAYADRGCDRPTIAQLCSEVLCKMVFEYRLFHADPHPGNVFITRDNTVAFLDLGMAGRLENNDVAAIADLFLSIFNSDSRACAQAVLSLSTMPPPADTTALEHDMADLIAFEAPAIIGGGQVARGIERAVQVIRRHEIGLAPRFSLLFKALATSETVGRSLDPGLDFVTIIQPYIEKFVLARYGPPAVLKAVRQSAGLWLRLSRQFPGDFAHVLNQLRRGKLRVELEHNRLDQLANTIDRASNRTAVSTITAALIIGSSLLIASDSAMGRLGVAGFVFAGLLGLTLIISILWSRKF